MEYKRYLIVDDSKSDALDLKGQLETLPFLELINITSTLEETICILVNQSVDLLFLDLRLGGLNGLSLLTNYAPLPPIIITTAFPEYAVESYEIGLSVDYLVKPYTYNRLLKAISRALSIQVKPSSLANSESIYLKMGRQIQRFDLKSIEYIEAYGIYSKVISNGQVFIVNERLLALEDLLDSSLFQRVHKSYMVNISKIFRFDRNNIWIAQTKIPVGMAYRPKLDRLFNFFVLPDESKNVQGEAQNHLEGPIE